MLAMLLLLIPAALLRSILKKPLGRFYALLIAFILLVLFTLSLDGIVGQPIYAAAAVLSYYALRSGQSSSVEQHSPVITKSMFASCPSCDLVQLSNHQTCQRCGAVIDHSIEKGASSPPPPERKDLASADSDLRIWAENSANRLREHVENKRISNRRAAELLQLTGEIVSAESAGDKEKSRLAREKYARLSTDWSISKDNFLLAAVNATNRINSLTPGKPFFTKLTDVSRRHKFALAIWLLMTTVLALCPPCQEECDVYATFNQELLWSYTIPLSHQFIWKVDTGRVVGPSEGAVNMEMVREFAREKDISSIKAGEQFKAKAISIRSSGEIYNPFTVDACLVRINWFLMFWYFAGISCFALIMAGILEAIRYRQ